MFRELASIWPFMFPKVATVITLTAEAGGVAEAELTQACILHAKELCARLQAMQCWADFIDPIRGRPHYTKLLAPCSEVRAVLSLRIQTLGDCKASVELPSHFLRNLCTIAGDSTR